MSCEIIKYSKGPNTPEEIGDFIKKVSNQKQDYINKTIEKIILNKLEHQTHDIIFGEYDRITFKSSEIIKEEIEFFEEKEKVAKELVKYEYKIIDYIKGTCKKDSDERLYKIGKILERYSDNDAIKKLFANSKVRTGTKNNFVITLSCNPIDVLYQSTHRGWTSCMNFDPGCFNSNPLNSMREGCLVLYQHKEEDIDITNPSARILLKPYEFIHGNSRHMIYGVANRVYGSSNLLKDEAIKINDWVNEKLIKDSNFDFIKAKFVSRTYNDGENREIKILKNKDALLSETFYKSSDFDYDFVIKEYKDEIKENNQEVISKIVKIHQDLKIRFTPKIKSNIILFDDYTKNQYLEDCYFTKGYEKLFEVDRETEVKLLNEVMNFKNRSKFDRARIAFDMINHNIAIPQGLIIKRLNKTYNSWYLIYMSQFMDGIHKETFKDYNLYKGKIIKSSDHYDRFVKGIEKNKKYVSQETFENMIKTLVELSETRKDLTITFMLVDEFRKAGYDVSFVREIDDFKDIDNIIMSCFANLEDSYKGYFTDKVVNFNYESIIDRNYSNGEVTLDLLKEKLLEENTDSIVDGRSSRSYSVYLPNFFNAGMWVSIIMEF